MAPIRQLASLPLAGHKQETNSAASHRSAAAADRTGRRRCCQKQAQPGLQQSKKQIQYERSDMQTKVRRQFLPFLALAVLALLFALWAGLLRLGWAIPSLSGLALAHGPLMVSGFVGSLIALERAVAIRQRWMLAAPVLTGLGALSLLLSPWIGLVLITAGSLGTLGILAVMVRREPRIHTVTMAVGALAWVVGNILWSAGFGISQIVYLWQAFLILTIGGERLELSRILRPSAMQVRLFIAAAAVLLAGAILAPFVPDLGARLAGLGLLSLSIWFLWNDVARRNIRHPSALTRYIAICLYAGFVWMGIGGTFQLYLGAQSGGALYDAALHSVFVGFVLSMIFGHAPIIFPAILGTPVAFLPVFYAQLALLHLSLILRITGDFSGRLLIRQWGGLLNEVAVLLFLGATAYAIARGRKKAELGSA